VDDDRTRGTADLYAAVLVDGLQRRATAGARRLEVALDWRGLFAEAFVVENVERPRAGRPEPVPVVVLADEPTHQLVEVIVEPTAVVEIGSLLQRRKRQGLLVPQRQQDGDPILVGERPERVGGPVDGQRRRLFDHRAG
jgi:hypothetical protein